MASACLVGVNCRYNGSSKISAPLLEKFLGGEVIPFCPELLAGLGVPRTAMQMEGGQGFAVLDGTATVKTVTGEDRTAEMVRGASMAADMAGAVKPETIYLKTGSPSCGWGMHKGKEVVGVTAALLARAGHTIKAVE